MSGWFSAQIVRTGRLPLFCFFVAFVVGFAARWRYSRRPRKLGKALAREERLRQPVIRAKIRAQDLLTGRHGPASELIRRL